MELGVRRFIDKENAFLFPGRIRDARIASPGRTEKIRNRHRTHRNSREGRADKFPARQPRLLRHLCLLSSASLDVSGGHYTRRRAIVYSSSPAKSFKLKLEFTFPVAWRPLRRARFSAYEEISFALSATWISVGRT